MTKSKTIEFAVDMANGEQYDAVAVVVFEVEGRRWRVSRVDNVQVVRECDGVPMVVCYDGPENLITRAEQEAEYWLTERDREDAERAEAAEGEHVDQMLDDRGRYRPSFGDAIRDLGFNRAVGLIAPSARTRK